jgi:hypothetical protein
MLYSTTHGQSARRRIVEGINNGLEAPELVFFFVSANSLNSNMVKLEWQNALAASKGKTRVIPVRVDGSAMPPIGIGRPVLG